MTLLYKHDKSESTFCKCQVLFYYIVCEADREKTFSDKDLKATHQERICENENTV